MGKKICKYAIPMKPPYPFKYACAVMYECRYKKAHKKKGATCIRFQIGENRERNGQKLLGKWVIEGYGSTIERYVSTEKPQNLLNIIRDVKERLRRSEGDMARKMDKMPRSKGNG